MTPILFLLLAASPQLKPVHKGPAAKAQVAQGAAGANTANNRFLKFLLGAKEVSVHMALHRQDRPTDGQADLTLQRPGDLFYHLTWGPEDYTYTVHNGQAMEIDKGIKLYDEYPVASIQPPEANGSAWVATCFPQPFASEDVQLTEKSVDANGHLLKWGTSDDNGVLTIITFTDYKTNETQPDAKFTLKAPIGYSCYEVQRLAPPVQIGRELPDVSVTKPSGGTGSIKEMLAGKPTFIAVLDPKSEPSVDSVKVLQQVKGLPVMIVSTGSASGLNAGPLPVYSAGPELVSAWRVNLTPLFYVIDAKGKVTNVWYGFNKDAPNIFATEISDAVSEVTGS